MKKISLLVITILGIVSLYPNNIKALTDSIEYKNINENSNVNNTSDNEYAYSLLSGETLLTKPSQNSLYSSYDYVIDSYDVNIMVNENNTFDITETITVYFNISKHGIYRKIPLKNEVTRLDGTTSTNRAKITNLKINNDYSASREYNNYKIQIGSVSETITGEQKYVISYNYNIGKDPVKNYDEFYYNIIGDEWDTVIGNVTFTIIMPKEFDASKLGFSSGVTGSTNSDNINYSINGNVISGSYDGILSSHNALTVRLELDEGYFVDAGFTTNTFAYLIYVLPIIFLVIAIFLWYMFGRDDEVIETVEFYPPSGFNSLEIGFLYKGLADKSDVVSLLIYLANKGYIKISETEENSLFSKSKEFKITKLREYDGNNVNEKFFLEGLFKKKITYTSLFGKNDDENNDNVYEVTSSDLYDNFYVTMNKILSNINHKENRDKIFEKSASSKTIFIVLMILATYCITTIPPVFIYGEPSSLFLSLLLPGFGFTFMFMMLFGKTKTVYVNGKATNSPIATKMFGLFWGAGFGGIPFAFMLLPVLLEDEFYLVGYIIGLICVCGMVICLNYLPKRTLYGNQMLGKLRGFKNFLETAEKSRLEAMVMQDPSYFYNILPYTYVLGVSDKWIKNFESISLQAPSWYDSSNTFDVATFGLFMNSTMTSAQRVMSSSPSSDSGSSGSSGGGFSGGGSGGGGGGSW